MLKTRHCAASLVFAAAVVQTRLTPRGTVPDAKLERGTRNDMEATMRQRLIVTLALLAALTEVAAAHHSAAQFDLTIRDNEVEGVVKVFEPANPHTRIVLEVTDEKGTRDVEFEGHSRNNYSRSGLRPGMVNVGDRVTLIAAPMRDGSDGGYVLGVRLEDGTQF